MPTLPPEERSFQVPRPIVLPERLSEESGRGGRDHRVMCDEEMEAGTIPGDGQHVPHQEPCRRVGSGHPGERVILRHEMRHDALVSERFPVGPGTPAVDHVDAGTSSRLLRERRADARQCLATSSRRRARD